MVDIGSRPYRTRARLYTDSAATFEIEWYEARTDAPLLGFPSALNNLDWEGDRDDWLETRVGEVFGEPREQTYEPLKRAATGGHVCGTAEDFLGNGHFDNGPPFVEYREDGLPTCCGDVATGVGGAAVGGTALVFRKSPAMGGLQIGGRSGQPFPHIDPTAGGLELGGQAGDRFTRVNAVQGGLEFGGEGQNRPRFADPAQGGLELGGEQVGPMVDPAQGGLELGGQAGDKFRRTDRSNGGLQIGGKNGDRRRMNDPPQGGVEIGGQAGDRGRIVDQAEGGAELGGQAGDVWQPGAPVPGVDCAHAGAITLGVPFDVDMEEGPGSWWFKFDSLMFETYHATVLDATGASVDINFWSGSDCGHLSLMFTLGGGCQEFSGTGGTVWIEFVWPPIGTATRQIVVDLGPC